MGLMGRGWASDYKSRMAIPPNPETLSIERDPVPAVWEDNAAPGGPHALEPSVAPGVVVDSIHGGDVIPERLAETLGQSAGGKLLDCEIMQAAHHREKDWGADQVAQDLSSKLGLAGWWRVRIARCLMDFGRFPGETRPGASHLGRFAISDPSARFLAHDQKRELLSDFFDPISNQIESIVPNRSLKIAVHTYDRLNETGTERPLVSLIYRSESYQRLNRMPYNVFDRVYPDHLAEFTVDRRLVARISLELEKIGVTVAYNHPYALPEGSVEVRSQVWFFFLFARAQFLDAFPDTHDDPHFLAVWKMLMDTNLRDAQAGMLRDYLHLMRTVPAAQEPFFRACGLAYERVARFIKQERIAHLYRHHPERPSSLAVEVRKDFVWQFEDAACRKPVLGPEGARRDNIDLITSELARAIRIYFDDDHAPDPHLVPGGRPPRAR